MIRVSWVSRGGCPVGVTYCLLVKPIRSILVIFTYWVHWRHKKQPNLGNIIIYHTWKIWDMQQNVTFQKWTLRMIRLPINWHMELQWPARQHCVGPMWLMLKCSLQWMCLVLRWLVVTPRGQQKNSTTDPLVHTNPVTSVTYPPWNFLYPTQGWHRPHACANWIQVFEICEGTKEIWKVTELFEYIFILNES